MQQLGFRLTGVGSALPEKIVTNDDLSATMDTNDEWIRERTGIARRHVGGTTSGLAAEAAELAMKRAGAAADEIDQLLLATTSPEFVCPGTAPAAVSYTHLTLPTICSV